MIKFCVICGEELIGRQRVLCFNKECHEKRAKNSLHNWYQNNRAKKEINFCIICGKLLVGGQRKLCSEECRKENKRRYYGNYYQDNQEKLNKQNREYRQNNQEKMKEYDRKYGREYYQNNREDSLEYERRRYRRSRGLSENCDLRKESGIEIIMGEWLQDNGIEFIPQYYINLESSTWTHVDFFIEPNICLYVDGGYYHLLPNAKKCDENQNKILPQMGYKVIRMAEVEILAGNRPWELKS